MVFLVLSLRFWQEWKASEATDSLMKMVKNTCLAKRAGEHEEEIDITELVPGILCIWQLGTWFPLIFGSSIRKTCSLVRLH